MTWDHFVEIQNNGNDSVSKIALYLLAKNDNVHLVEGFQ